MLKYELIRALTLWKKKTWNLILKTFDLISLIFIINVLPMNVTAMKCYFKLFSVNDCDESVKALNLRTLKKKFQFKVSNLNYLKF